MSSNVPQLRFPEFEGEWEKKKLDEVILQFIVPMRDKPKELTGDIPWCRIEDFDGKYLSSSKSEQGVSKTTVKNMNLKINPINTLLVSCSANLGFCAITKNELITNQTFIGLVPNNFILDIEYLYYTMRLSAKRLNVLSSGTTISYLSRVQFEKFKIPVPPLPEQTRIATFLSSVDEKLQALKKKKELLEQYKKGAMQKLFSQELRFKQDDGSAFPDWEEKKLGEIFKIGSGKDYKHLSEGNVPVYGTGGHMLFVDDYLYDGESVGIGRKGTINKPIYLTGKFWTVDTLFYTHSFVRTLPYFVYLLFQQINWLKYNEASGVPSLSKTTIEKIKINLPSLPEQEKIADFLSSIDESIENVGEQIEALQEWKKGLLQKMFV